MVVDAKTYSIKEPSAVVAWYKAKKETCLQLDQKPIYCQAGDYVFSSVVRISDFLYASYSYAGNSELWRVEINNSEVVKTPMDFTIQSLVFGP